MNNTPNSILPEVQQLINRGALFVVNHSAGKDSQAMTIFLKAVVPSEQLLVIHADLGEVEWPGNVDHIKSTIGNLPFEICKNENRTFLEMVRQRGMWPSPSQRQCTSDLKRGPIERTIRRHLAANPQFGGLVVNCMGIRAQESPARKKQIPFRLNSRNSLAERKLKNGKTVPAREWFDWLPIFELSEKEVFSMIEDAKQKPHWAYGGGHVQAVLLLLHYGQPI